MDKKLHFSTSGSYSYNSNESYSDVDSFEELEETIPDWTHQEDESLIRLVSGKGTQSWADVARTLTNKSARQCRERWLNRSDSMDISHRMAELSPSQIKIKPDPDAETPFKKPCVSPIRTVSPVNNDHAYSVDSAAPAQLAAQEQSYGNYLEFQPPMLPYGKSPILSDFTNIRGIRPTNAFYNSQLLPPQPTSAEKPRTPIKFSSLTAGSVGRARIDKRSLSSVAKQGLVPLTSPAFKQNHEPNILRKKRRRSEQENKSGPKQTRSSTIASNYEPNLNTPVKTLPFSPSKFFNSPIGPSLSKALTSTPMCSKPIGSMTPIVQRDSPLRRNSHRSLKTPLAKKNIFNLISDAQTPTPFKRALAAIEEKSGPTSTENHTPAHLYDDLQEVIARDTGAAAFQADLSGHFGSYRFVRDTARVTQNLERRLTTPARKRRLPGGFSPETPSKILAGDLTLALSPPSLLRETLSLNDAFIGTNSPDPSGSGRISNLLNPLIGNITQRPGYYMITCGQTEDQFVLTQVAENWLRFDSTNRPIRLLA